MVPLNNQLKKRSRTLWLDMKKIWGETDNVHNISQTEKHMLWPLIHHLAEII
jgi:hypothetical protein